MLRRARWADWASAIMMTLGMLQAVHADPTRQMAFHQDGENWDLKLGDQRLATYVTGDPKTSRPFWCNLVTREGTPVTRPHPPTAGELDDHPTMHPGVWMAFGDVSGNDYWRLKSRVRHARFSEPPEVKDGVARLAVINEYLDSSGDQVVMVEDCRWTARLVDDGWLLTVKAAFSPGSGRESVVFGDQEEMGLGMRMAIPFAERKQQGGRVADADGRESAAAVWGKSSAWCDYSMPVGERRIGATTYPSTDNFRTCWWHVRDTGLMVANPFGRKALTGREPSEVSATSTKPVVLKFAIRIYNSSGQGADHAGFADRAEEVMDQHN